MNALKYSLSAFLKIVWFCCVSKACSFNSRSWFMAVTCSRVHHRGQILILIFFKSLRSSLRSWAGTLCYEEACFIPCHFPRRAEGMVSPYLLGEWRTRRQMKSQSNRSAFQLLFIQHQPNEYFLCFITKYQEGEACQLSVTVYRPLGRVRVPSLPTAAPWGRRRSIPALAAGEQGSWSQPLSSSLKSLMHCNM